MNKHDQLMAVYRHKNTGYIPNFFTDFDFSKPPEINERAEQGGTDWFGVEWTFVPVALAPMVTPNTKRLTDITEWREQLVFPDLSAYDWEAFAAKETAEWDRENKLSFMMIINGPFERMHALMGFEDAFVAMYEYPEHFKALIERVTDYKVELVDMIAKHYRPDILNMHDDFGNQTSLMMSVDMWREYCKPSTKRIIDAVKSHGIIYQHHSCGYIEPLFDDLVELGIDAIDPLQPSNDNRALKDKYQDRVTFVGGFDTQNVFDKPGITEEEIRAEVRRVYALLGPGGSYVAFPLTLTFDFVPLFIDEHYKNAFLYA
jgi:uroporphyrinogen decarboxylase